jgi:hypothetical protein
MTMRNIVQRIAARVAANPVFPDVVGFTFQARPPASEAAVRAAERRLGFRLPETLREIYLTVANGGFGPGYGVMGVEGGFTDDMGHTVADLYEIYREGDPTDPTWLWPEGLVPICHWGCVIYSAVDCSQESAPVAFVDVSAKEPGEPMSCIIHAHKPSIDQWLVDWLDGKDLWGEVWGRGS